ncbi:MAG: hypothetical protein R3B70_01135 [Polyangiaceae bacterium]
METHNKARLLLQSIFEEGILDGKAEARGEPPVEQPVSRVPAVRVTYFPDDRVQVLYYHRVVRPPASAPKYRSELFQSIYVAGKESGKALVKADGVALDMAKGTARCILLVLDARRIPPSDAGKDIILGCRDQAILNEWLTRAVTAELIHDVIAPACRPPAESSSPAPKKQAPSRKVAKKRAPRTQP